jgi:AcrR family transcriptional regulator
MQALIRDPRIENRVLDATDRLLAKGTYHDLTMEAIGREAAVSRTTLCLYYRTREDVILSHFDRVVRRIVVVEKEIAAQPSPPPNRIWQVLLFRVLAYFDSTQHFVDSLDEIFRSVRTELLERRQHYVEWEAEVIESILRQSPRTIKWCGHEIHATGRAFLGATESLLPYNCISQELGTRRHLAKRAEKIINVVVNGLFGEEMLRPQIQTTPRQVVAFSDWTHKLLETAA